METKSQYLRTANHNTRNPETGALSQYLVLVQYNGGLAPVTKAILAHRLAGEPRLAMDLDAALAFIARNFAFSGYNHPSREATVEHASDGFVNYRADGCGGGRPAADVVHIDLTK